MYYVSYIEEYPIYEAAEGGYYYAGESVVNVRPCKTWRKARQIFNKWRKWFEQEYADDMFRGIYSYEAGGCDKNGDGSLIGYSGKYAGDGCAVRLTRYNPTGKGRVPYC